MHVVPGGNYTHHQFTQELSGFIACCLVQLPVGHTMIPRRSHPNRHTTFRDRFQSPTGTRSDRSHPTKAHGLGNIPMDSLRNPRHVNTMISGLYDVWSYRVNTMISGLYDLDLISYPNGQLTSIQNQSIIIIIIFLNSIINSTTH